MTHLGHTSLAQTPGILWVHPLAPSAQLQEEKTASFSTPHPAGQELASQVAHPRPQFPHPQNKGADLAVPKGSLQL